MIRDEAKDFMYQDREFIFPAMQDFIHWVPRIGSNVELLTHITVRKSGAKQLKDFYGILAKVPSGRLQQVQVALSAKFKAALRDHITDQWNKGEPFFVGDDISQDEGRRRVDLMIFTIGPSQKSVLDSNDSEDVMKEISAEDREEIRKIMEDWIPTYADSKGIKGTKGGQKKGWAWELKGVNFGYKADPPIIAQFCGEAIENRGCIISDIVQHPCSRNVTCCKAIDIKL